MTHGGFALLTAPDVMGTFASNKFESPPGSPQNGWERDYRHPVIVRCRRLSTSRVRTSRVGILESRRVCVRIPVVTVLVHSGAKAYAKGHPPRRNCTCHEGGPSTLLEVPLLRGSQCDLSHRRSCHLPTSAPLICEERAGAYYLGWDTAY